MMSKWNAARFERYWHRLKLTIAGTIISTGLIETVMWGRNHINISIDLLKVKVANELEMTKQYKRQADALEDILASYRAKGHGR